MQCHECPLAKPYYNLYQCEPVIAGSIVQGEQEAWHQCYSLLQEKGYQFDQNLQLVSNYPCHEIEITEADIEEFADELSEEDRAHFLSFFQ